MIHIRSDAEIAKMRAAGLVVESTLSALRAAVTPGISTAELDAIAEKSIRDAGAVPSFKGYQGFPASICASVNHQVVHGIPSDRQVLADGDVISIDCGAILDGWHGDSAVTVPIGAIPDDAAKLIADCEESMWRGLAAVRDGARLSDIGHAIESYVRGAGAYGLVEEYGGHGIGTEMHMEPFIPNYGRPGKGMQLRPGMCFAIEPMINLGTAQTDLLDDGWTVETKDGALSAHFEHTVALTEDGPWVLTARDGGRAALERLGVPNGANRDPGR
ncbi:MAG TPA: type I methionyl aminopeptidase [Streptosporangiaceae bacterium]